MNARPRGRLRLAAALLAALCAAHAAGGELKAWSGGGTPPLALRDLDGREHKLSDYRGKVVVLNFWATWCEPCRREMPSMQRLQDRLAGRPFAVLAVDFGEGPPQVREFLRKLPVRFTVLLDRDLATAGAWKVNVLPTSLVIDAGLKIRYSAIGDLEWDSPPVEDAIRKLLPAR
jgi:thiol-disulfide isomerase/thioredoxin